MAIGTIGNASGLARGIASSLQRCERTLEMLLTHRGNPSLEVEQVLADDPQCVFGHCIRAALIVLADDTAARPSLVASVAVLEAASADMNEKARRHAAAASAWLEGNPGLAAERYGAIAADCPHDSLALMVAHALDFRLGQRQMLRDRIAQALPAWDAARPGYASVLAMYAFGLEENGEYDRAEMIARRALDIDPTLPAAIHVLSHVMEMQGRTREGLAFLVATEAAWREGTGFSVHLAWHKALFHLDAVDPHSALKVYDEQIAKPGASEMSALADASALLWRLQLRNTELAGRWEALADRWERHAMTGVRPFYVVHAMMAFSATRRFASAIRALQALPRAGTGGASQSLPEEELAAQFCEALLAYARGDYAMCVEWLVRVRHIADRCGGSLAQCDLIHLTFTEAALRARKGRLARTLVAERAAQKPASLLNRLLQERLLAMPTTA
jgi:tetratricopeptide (TPR) repeat protein